jgi:serine/threonine protein kinase
MSSFTIENQFRYRVVRKLYEGGMGIVYEAEQLGAHGFVKRVALKLIRENFARQQLFLDNFIGEAKLVADLIHTNIVQTYQLGESSGQYFIAMELIRGVNLEQFLHQLAAKQRPLPRDLAVFIASRIARGLAYAHAKTDGAGHPLGIVHRDVSMKNILIAFEGDVKLTDFGIAKARGFLTDQEGEVVAGKADYMSPEQADFKVTDKRSDLFSTGVVLAHLLLGRNVFKAETPEQSRERILTLPVPDFATLHPEVDVRLNGILHRLLARDLGRRYQTADEVLGELERFIYSAGYGPTNETLGKFIREVFGQHVPVGGGEAAKGGTALLERTSRIGRPAAAV